MARDLSFCYKAIEDAVARPLTKEEKVDIERRVQAKTEEAMQDGNIDNVEQFIYDALSDMAVDQKIMAKIEKRNAYLNAMRTAEMTSFVNSHYADNPVRGFEALISGIQSSKVGTRFSASMRQEALHGKYLGGAINDLQSKDLMTLLTKGEMDQDIARALFDMDSTNPKYPGVQKEAKQIAEIMHKWQEVARDDANKAGAWVGKLDGYIVRQSHDQHKIHRAGADQWKGDMIRLLDHTKTFKDTPASKYDEFLNAVHKDLASGVHIKPGPSTGLKGVGNVGKTMSHERTLHFKDADAWHEYNLKYGKGNLREAFLSGLQSNAQKTGLMRAMGPNAKLNLENAVKESILKTTDIDTRERLNTAISESGKLDRYMRHVDGSANIAVNQMGAKISAGARAIQSMSKLGGAVLSAFPDIATFAGEASYQGRGFFGGLAEGVSQLVNGIGGNAADKKRIANSLGVYFDSVIGETGARFSGHDDIPGSMSRMMQTFFKFNGLSWWTDTLRTGFAVSQANYLHGLSGSRFIELDADMQRTLGLFGINNRKWDIIRNSEAISDDSGRMYLTPESIAKVDDATFAAYLREDGMEPTARRIDDLKNEITDQFSAYFRDRSEQAVIEPDAKTRAVMLQGTRPGTITGELLRFAGQFKQFPFAVVQKTVGRELYGRGVEIEAGKSAFSPKMIGKALSSGNGELFGLSRMLLTMTAFGYMAMAAKDISKGKEPREPSKEAIMAAMLQGGALGIYGDFLFGESRNRFGDNFVTTMAGPTASSVNDLMDIYGRIMDGDDTAAAAFKTAIDHTPFANVFWGRPLLNYLMLNDMQESLNPGYLRRIEQRNKQDLDQNYWNVGGMTLKPTESRLWSD
jgi:hypothetical protein